MTFTKFEELLHTKYPEASTCMHGKFAGTQRNNKVEINFQSHSKCYCYYGSYKEILNRLGIKVIEKFDIENAKVRIEHYKAENGKPNPFFKDEPIDNSQLIEEVELWLKKIEDERYIIVD